MTARTLRIVIVDDDAAYRSKLRTKLTDRALKCVLLPPPAPLSVDAILDEKPDAVLVDYELTKPQESGQPPADYFGSLLVAAIQGTPPYDPNHPADASVSCLGPGLRRFRASSLNEVFDDLLFKENVDKHPGRLRVELRSLVEGYRTLAASGGTWKDVFAAMKAPVYARDELRQLGSPAGALRPKAADTTDTFRPGSIARWIRRLVLRFPGPLVDDLRAATDLGVAAKALTNKTFLEWLEPAAYKGVFASEQRRWWRGALRDRANSLRVAGATGEDAARFRHDWNKKHPGARFSPSRCCVCGEPTSDAVCELLKEPVMFRHSVQFYPDSRPAGFDVARISFRAIKTKELNDENFASNVLPLVREIEDSK